MRATKEVMGFDPDRHFWVDERVYEHMSLREQGAARAGGVAGALRRLARGVPGDGRGLGSGLGRAQLRDGWREALPEFEAGEQIATRSAGPEGDGGLRGVTRRR